MSEENPEVIRYLTGGALVRVNRVTDKPEPELAESWNCGRGWPLDFFPSARGIEILRWLRADGGGCARTFNTALDPKLASPAGDTFRSEGGIPEAKAISPRDVVILYPTPKADMDRLFDSFSIIPANPGKMPVSAGPFLWPNTALATTCC